MPDNLKEQKELIYRMSCHGGEYKQLVEQEFLPCFVQTSYKSQGEILGGECKGDGFVQTS